MELRFGKYKGCLVSDDDVPREYLEWLLHMLAEQVESLKAELARRDQVDDGNLPWAERIVQAGFRTLAKQHHPDHGGSNEQMRELLGANAELQRVLQAVERKAPASARGARKAG